MIWRNMRYPGWESAEGQNKLYSFQRALKRDENANVLPSNEGHLSGLHPV